MIRNLRIASAIGLLAVLAAVTMTVFAATVEPSAPLYLAAFGVASTLYVALAFKPLE